MSAGIDRNLLEKLSADRALASAVLFSHRHPQASPDFHVEIVDLWRCADEFVLIEAFREGGKSTLSEEFLVLEGCFGNSFYTLLIGETYMKACQRLEAIANEAAHNIKLHSLFGGKVLARKPVENKVWFKSGMLIEAVGWEQELQSFKYLDHRPDTAYLDDPENLERVRDSASVDASEKKFWLELVPALDKTHRRIRLTQTRRAEDCLVTRFARNPSFVYRAFPICNGDIDAPTTQALWPSRYPMEWIRRERDIYRNSGRLSDFLQSRMLQAVNPESKPFKESHIRSMDVAPWQWMPKYVIYDPARTKVEGRSDQYGKVVVSRFGSKILVHESSGEHWAPNEMVDDLFLANERHAPILIGIEKNSLDDWLMQPVRLEIMRRGVALPLRALQAPQDRNKVNFILGLQPFFEAGDVVLVGGKLAHPGLVAEILNFPQGQVNILNALAYSLRMFSGQPVYEDFSQANIAESAAARPGETVLVGWGASPTECVCVAVLRHGRSIQVARDYSASAAPLEAVKILAANLRMDFPQARFQCWVGAELYDQWQRIALVPALRAAGFSPFRGEHAGVSRGTLTEKIRSVVRNRRMLTVDPAARLTANALSAGYCIAVERGTKTSAEPEPGISRMVAESLECLTYQIEKAQDTGELQGAHQAVNAQGQTYTTALPTRR